MKTRYIFSSGSLKRQDNTLQFRNLKNDIVNIPIENTKELYILNEVTINTKLLDYLSRYGIIIHFFNYYENYSGTYYPKDKYLSGKLKIKQVEKYLNNKEEIATSIVNGIAINMVDSLYHYYRHGNKDIKFHIDYIKKFSETNLIENLKIKNILYIEGELWKTYYDSLKYILPKDFLMKTRIKRPPDNQINALISFGNTLLYTKTISTIYQTHLDQTISFLHEPSEQRFSLSLDLSEVFKPVIVFKTIFELLNNKIIKADIHFEKNLNYCILNEEGKKIFVTAFEERINKIFINSKLKRKTTYLTAIKYDGYKLIKNLMEGITFKPFNNIIKC